MEDSELIDKIHNTNNLLTNNQLLINHYSVSIVLSMIIILIGAIATKIIPRWINNIMKTNDIDVTIIDFCSAIIKYGIIIVTIITTLGCLGVQTTSIVAVIGAAGLAIGLALQSSLANFAAGILLVSFRYFRTGDYVDFSGTTGTIVIIKIFATKLRTVDGRIVIIPNSKILSNNIINFSEESHRLINITLRVNYTTDIQLVKKLVTDILWADNRILHNKGITVCLTSFNKASLNFMVCAWVPRNELQNTTSDLLEQVKKIFDQHHIIPLNTLE